MGKNSKKNRKRNFKKKSDSEDVVGQILLTL